MFMSDVSKKDEIKSIAIEDLEIFGIKLHPPRRPKLIKNTRPGKVFNRQLDLLPTKTVTLRTGQQMIVPKIVHYLCSFIIKEVETEGLFRKECTKQRQQELKAFLDDENITNYSNNLTIIEAATILKTFLRELPEPLIPFNFHDYFFQCATLKSNTLEALLLICLLLPTEYLNTLSYLMQFFNEITEYSSINKMNAYNLSVCISPTILPIEDKFSGDILKIRLENYRKIIQLLIENAGLIGVLPENIISRIGKFNNDNLKKKKRRSGSLTRMFSGLIKMVSGKSEENVLTITPDTIITPIIKRRRVDNNSGISLKKRKDILDRLPGTNYRNNTPIKTPMKNCFSSFELTKEKNDIWYSRTKLSNTLKNEESIPNYNVKLKRSITSSKFKNDLKINKSNLSSSSSSSSSTTTTTTTTITKSYSLENCNKIESDYVRVPKIEYENIKNRVNAIEKRLSFELDNVQSQINNKNLNNVQTAYEQTLNQSKLSPTSDNIAKRLNRELKIRRNSDCKIIRSPSARKINSMRRRSKDFDNQSTKLIRNKSWHVERKSNDNKLINNNDYFKTPSMKIINQNFNDRASIAKIRSQNAGMVLAKARLFDDLNINDNNSIKLNKITGTLIRNSTNKKIESIQNNDNKIINNNSLSKKTKKIILNEKQKSLNYKGNKENTNDKKSPIIKRGNSTISSKKYFQHHVNIRKSLPLKSINYTQQT